MKTLGIALALTLIVGGASIAAPEQVSYDTYAGWNLIAAPLVPVDDPAPAAVFNQFDLQFTAGLLRFDAPSQAQIAFDPWASPDTTFGNVLLGDGYWLYNPTGGNISYNGVPDGVPDVNNNKTDMWISLPGSGSSTQPGGWHLIGHPFNHDTAIDPNADNTGSAILFTDGTTVKSWSDAVTANWVADSALYFDGATQAQFSTGYFFNDDDHFRAGKGYWVYTKVNNLAMIIPAN